MRKLNPVTIAISVLTLLFTACTPTTAQREASVPAKPERPNILLIVADDMGYSDIGSFGGEVATPALDTLAKEGLQMTNFHVLPTCSPTRSVLLSGVDNHRAGLGTMGELHVPEMQGYPGYVGHLNFEVAALPEVLKSSGYHTYMAGKWHLGDEQKTGPHARGFEEAFTLLGGGGSHWGDQRKATPTQTMVYMRNGEVVESLPDDFYSTLNYTDAILGWLEEDQDDDQPFFAYLAYTAPHDPLHAPREYIEKYKGIYDQGWDILRAKRLQQLKELGIINKDAKPFPRLPTVPAWKDLPPEARVAAARDMEVYAAMVDYMDVQIKRVFDYLKENGKYDNTLIIFFSDNGANGARPTAYPGQTEEFLAAFDNELENRGLPDSFVNMGPGWAQASMTPSRLFKIFPAEGGIRAPLLVKLPGEMTNAGKMNHSFVHVRDIMPTILDLADVRLPKRFNGHPVSAMQGTSALALFDGTVTALPAEAGQVGYELFGMKAYFDGNWKVLWMPKPFSSGDWQLFNLEEDPAEMNDLGKQYPDKLKQMIGQWEQYKSDNEVIDFSLNLAERLK